MPKAHAHRQGLETKTPSLEFYHPHLLRTWVSRLQDLSRNPELQFHDCQREILQASTKRGFVSYDLPMISLLFRELMNQQGPDLCPVSDTCSRGGTSSVKELVLAFAV